MEFIKSLLKPAEELQKLNEERSTQLMGFINSLRKNPLVNTVVDCHYLNDGIVALVSLQDGNAVEIQVRPAASAGYFPEKRKHSQYQERKNKEMEERRQSMNPSEV